MNSPGYSPGAQYAPGDQWRNNSKKNEGMEPKQKQYPVVDVTGDKSKVRCYKEHHSKKFTYKILMEVMSPCSVDSRP